MNRITLLEQLKKLTQESVGDIIMPVRMQKGDTEPILRSADVYLMRLPDSNASQKKAPYIIHQLITARTFSLRVRTKPRRPSFVLFSAFITTTRKMERFAG